MPELDAKAYRVGPTSTKLIAVAFLITTTSPALAAKGPWRVTTVEVATKSPKKTIGSTDFIDGLKRDVMSEASWYDDGVGKPVTMRIRLDKINFRSAGKAITSKIPVVGMFTGPNINALKGRVELVDPGTGKVVKKTKLMVNDKTGFDAGGFAADTATGLLSFIPGLGLIAANAADLAIGVGRSVQKRDEVEAKMSANFAMQAFRGTFDRKAVRAALARKKASKKLAPRTEGAPADVSVPIAQSEPATPTTVAPVPAVVPAAAVAGPATEIGPVPALAAAPVEPAEPSPPAAPATPPAGTTPSTTTPTL